jgi:hypothetical protein
MSRERTSLAATRLGGWALVVAAFGFIREFALNLFFFCVGVAALRSMQVGRWFASASMIVAVTGWIAALRNATSLVDPIAEINNYLLPIWIIVLGVAFIRWRTPSSSAKPLLAAEPA